jgi:hypothetical protein
MEHLTIPYQDFAQDIRGDDVTSFLPAAIDQVTEPSGTWVNVANDQTRLSLTRDGRYSKTMGVRQGAYSGRYACQGTRIRFIDDFDFVVTGELRGNILRVGDYTYRRAA